ncbi:MAG TPA: prolyl oligopeptidase family serine peptidase [Blastocatellia bacterium]|nr:prolyl oligopeptidase family serine peptidase [Blastocatellia bacterium]
MIRSNATFARSTKKALTLLLLALLLAPVTAAQQTAQQPVAKRALTHADYDSWRSIQSPQLSRDGKFLAYVLVPQDGDGEVVVRNLSTGGEWRHTRGAQSVNLPPPQGPPQAGPPPGARLAITADSRFAVFQILPTKAEMEKAKKEKKKPEDMPKNALGIMDLATGEVARVEKVKSFQVPEDGAGFIAYLLEPRPEEKKADEKKDEKKPEAAPAPAGRRSREKKKEYGSDLVLRSLADKSERIFADVLEYSFSKDAKNLVFAVSSRKEESNGLYSATAGTADAPAALLTGPGKYTKITWDDKQTQLAFLSDRDDAKASQPRMKLYHWDRMSASATELVSTATPNFRQGLVISERGQVSFSLDGSKLLLGVAPAPEPEKDESEEVAADDKVVVDLWHWKDDYIQPMQRVRAEQDRNRSYRAVFHLKEKKFIQLADETMESVNPASDGRFALGSDDREYRVLVGYDTNYSDYFLVNTMDGSRKPLLKKQQWSLSWSPSGKYALFYDGKDWNTLSVPEGRRVNLTGSLGVNFWQEDHDSPSIAPSYGVAGWTADDKYVLLYDRYDIWQVSPDGSGAKNLTDGAGRKEKIHFRYVRLDPQERFIDPSKPMLLRAENEWTRDSGFYRDRIDGGPPQRLLMASKFFSTPSKAKNADVFLLTTSTFNEYPDLLVTGPDFKNMKKVSDANPQKSKLLWGTAEHVRYKNLDGVQLSAMLIKPENFDPSKKYPMIVYIYETLSEGLHRFVDPRPGHNINASYYSSNGYLVLMPDIVYTVGHPGQSALKCVLPAVQAVVDKGFVNENAIGIQGHSWGGYQIAYMITQTTRFKAASAGAPVSNMTSAYSGIRWGSGLPRQFQYERTQSRIGGSLWQSPMLFLENSPVFWANQVQTPLIMIHNDNDDAVPWYQGIEYFLALRRLGKEAYLFNYNGEFHGLRRRANQKDYAMRLQQFFDHYLKGAPKPEWMQRGIPYLEREKEKEQYKPAPPETKAAAQR